MAGIALFAGVFCLYSFSFSSVPTADGYLYVSSIDRSDYRWVLNASSVLTSYSFFTLKRLLTSLGFSVGTLSLIQTVNAAAAGAGVVLFYGVVRLLGGSLLLGILGGGLLATSFGYWYFANGEYQHLSLVVLLLIFYLLLRMRVHGVAYGWRFLIGLGLMNAVAVLLRQENFLFGFTAVTLLAVGRPWREGLKDGLIYALAGSVGTAVLILVVGHFLLGASTLEGFVRWYFWLFDSIGGPQEYQAFEFAVPFDVPRVLKGQLTAFVFGTQAVADTVRNRTLLGHPKVGYLLTLTAFAYGMMTLLATDLWKTRRLLRARFLAPAAACAAWFLTYKILVHAWFWPTSTKYQVVTLPPLILLLLLGPITTQAETGFTAPRSASRVWVVAALLVVVFVGNFWGGILPWHQYGQEKETLAARQATNFQPEDLFISSESGIDVIFHRGGNYIEVKSVFVRASPKEGFGFIRARTSGREGFGFIRAAVDEQLKRNRRVYIYNFVPGPFTLSAINQAAVRKSEQLSFRDFDEFFAELRGAYVLRGVFSYWEESKAPLYLFGETLETFWEVTSRPAR